MVRKAKLNFIFSISMLLPNGDWNIYADFSDLTLAPLNRVLGDSIVVITETIGDELPWYVLEAGDEVNKREYSDAKCIYCQRSPCDYITSLFNDDVYQPVCNRCNDLLELVNVVKITKLGIEQINTYKNWLVYGTLGYKKYTVTWPQTDPLVNYDRSLLVWYNVHGIRIWLIYLVISELPRELFHVIIGMYIYD